MIHGSDHISCACLSMWRLFHPLLVSITAHSSYFHSNDFLPDKRYQSGYSRLQVTQTLAHSGSHIKDRYFLTQLEVQKLYTPLIWLMHLFSNFIKGQVLSSPQTRKSFPGVSYHTSPLVGSVNIQVRREQELSLTYADHLW